MIARRAAILIVAVLAGGCGESAAPEAAEPDDPVTARTARGPVTLTVRADRDSITVGEKLPVTLEVLAAPGVAITMPSPPDELGPFTVRERATPPDVPEPGGRRWTHRYLLDTFAAGPAEIPPFVVTFRDERPETVDSEGAPIDGTIESEPLAVEVRSVLAEDAAPSDFRDIRGAVDVPVEPPSARAFLLAGLAALALAAAGGVLWFVLRRRATPAAAAPVEPPGAWARRMLAALAARELPETGDHHAFYFELSDIVRGYIERRFALSAPERTTEEFLREARGHGALSGPQQELLAGFLRAADLVKFARHEPTLQEARAAFDAAGGFVDETAADPAGAGPEVGEAAA